MANAFYLHASKPELVTGLRAMKLYGDVTNERPDLGVLFGRYQNVPVIRGKGKSEMRKTPDKGSDSQVLWAHRGARPFVHADGRVHDMSVVNGKSKKGGAIKLMSAPTGDGKFVVHLETGIPEHWDMDHVAAFMAQLKPDQMRSHGSERIDDGSDSVLATRIRWQRPKQRIAGSADALDSSKGVRIYSGDAWLMSPGSEIFVYDITGRAFRVVCEATGPRVADAGTSNPHDRFLGLVKARKDRLSAADAEKSDKKPVADIPTVEPVEAKPSGWFGRK